MKGFFSGPVDSSGRHNPGTHRAEREWVRPRFADTLDSWVVRASMRIAPGMLRWNGPAAPIAL